MPNTNIRQIFSEYKKTFGKTSVNHTYDSFISRADEASMRDMYDYARSRYPVGAPKSYADFLSSIEHDIPKDVASRLTHEAVKSASARLNLTKPSSLSPAQARESLKTQGALLTEIPTEQGIETPTGASRVSPTEVKTGLVGLTPEGNLPSPTISSGLDDVLQQPVQVPKEGAFALPDSIIPSPTLQQPTALGSKVTRKGGEPAEEEPTVAGRFGAALLRGTATTIDAIGGWVETLANFGVAQSELEKKVYGAVGFEKAEAAAEKALAKATEPGNYLDLTTSQDYIKSLVGDKRISDTSIKNPLVKATLSGVEQFIETVPDLALIVGTGSPQAATRLGAQITPEVADFMYKYAPKTKNIVAKAVGRLLGEATTSPTALKALQVDWVQPFKAAAKSDFAVWLGSKEASLTMQESPEDVIGSVGEGVKAFGTGYASGLFFEKLGVTPVKLASSIAVKTGTPIAGLATNMVGTAGVGFGGDILLQTSEQVASGENINPDYYQAVAAAVGFAGATALHGRNIIANTKAGIRAEQWRNLYEMENATIDYCLNKSYDASTLNAKLDNVTKQREDLMQVMDCRMDKNGKYRKSDIIQLQALDAQASAYRQVLITQSFTKEILQNPERFITEVRENDNLKPEIKEQLISKIDAVVQEFDPINVEVRRLSDKVENLNFQMTQLPADDPMTPKKQAILAKQVEQAQERIASMELNPTYYYKGEFYDTHGALIDALNKRYTEGTSSDIIVRNDPQGEKLVTEAMHQMLDRKFNDSLKVMQKQATAKAEADPIKDETILANQQRLNLPTEPEMLVSQNAVNALDKAIRGEEADIAMVQHASDQLYGETKRLESMKDSDSRQFTIEQIENAQRQAYEDIAFAENYIQAKKAGEKVNVTELQAEAKATAEEAINDIRSRRQLLLPDEVKVKLNAPKPETKVEPVKPTKDASEQQGREVRPEGEQVPTERISDSDMPKVDRTELRDRKAPEEKEVTSWEELPVEQYVVLGDKGQPMVAGKERRAAIARQERTVREKLLAEHRKLISDRESAMRSAMTEERLSDWRKQNPDATEVEVAEQQAKFAKEAESATVTKAGGPLTDADVMLGARLATSYMREGIKKTADLFKEVSDNIKGALGVEITKKEFDRMMRTSLEEYGKTPRDIVKDLYSTAAKSATKRQIEEITGIRRKPEMVLLDVLKETRARYKEQERVASDAVKIGIKEGKLQAKESAFDKAGYREQLDQFLRENKDVIKEVNPELTPAMARAISKVDSWYTLDRAISQIKRAISNKEYANKLAERANQIAQVEKNLSKEGKSKFGTAQQEVADFLKVDRDSLPTELKSEYDKLLSDLSARSAEVPYDPFQLNQFLDNAKAQVDEGYAAYRERQIEKAVNRELAARSDYKQLEANEKEVLKRDIYATLAETSVKGLDKRTGKLTAGDKMVNDLIAFPKDKLMRLPSSVLSRIPLMVDKIAAGTVPARLYQDVVRPLKSRVKGYAIMEAHGKQVLPLLAELNAKVDGVREQLEIDMANTGLSSLQRVRLKDKLLFKPRYLLDNLFKPATKGAKPFYDFIVSPSSTAKTRAEADVSRAKIPNIQLWGRAYRAREKSGGTRFDSAFIQAMYLKSLEYEANKGIIGAHSPYDYFKQLTDYRNSYGVYTEKNTLRMRELWNKMRTPEGEVTSESIKAMILPEEMTAIDYMRKWYSTEGLQKVRDAEVLFRGGYLETYDNYSHNFIVGGNNTVTPEAFVDQVMGGPINSNMSVRGATTYARSGQTGILNIDPIATFNRAVESTYYDYHMTPVISETLGAFKVMEDMTTDKTFRDILQSIEKAYRNDITISFEKSMSQTTNTDKLLNAMGGAFYSGALASLRRVPQELASNVSSVLIYDPVPFMEGVKAIKSIQRSNTDPTKYNASGYEELFDFAGIQNRFRRNVEDQQRFFEDTAMSGYTIRTGLWDRIVDKVTHNDIKNIMDNFNKSVISISDDMVGTRYFVGKFLTEYKKNTGTSFDIAKFKSEEAYRFDNEEAILKAAREASYHTNLMTNTANTLEGIQALKVRSTSPSQLFRDINNVLAGFSMHEAAVMGTAIKSGLSTGVLSGKQAVSLFAAVTARNIIYNTVLEFGARAAWAGVDEDYTVSNALYDVFGPEQLARQTVGAWMQTAIGARGNLARLPLQFALSKANKWVTEQWLGKEFDPDEHKLGMEGPDIMSVTSSLNQFVNLTGPYQLPIKLAQEGAKAYKTIADEDTEAVEKWQSLMPVVWATQKAFLPLTAQRDMEGLMKQSINIMEQDGELKDLFTPEPLSKALLGEKRTERIQEQMEAAKGQNEE